jgi:7-cyano-7-deazaguanine synthase
MNFKTKALVLFSGGQDSTTCLFWAKEKFDQVESIGFNYGQRHELELENAKSIALLADVPYYITEINTLSDISKNALTSSNIEVEKGINPGSTPNTLVEGRNLLFLTYAAIYAKHKQIKNLVMGVGQTDYSGYPDCRNEFIQSAQKTLSLAIDYKLTIHTPLMWKSKAETWQLADELNVLEIVRNKTLTCYNGILADGCGTCPACILRKKGYEEYQNLKQQNHG